MNTANEMINVVKVTIKDNGKRLSFLSILAVIFGLVISVAIVL